jgi:hypothetical protein
VYDETIRVLTQAVSRAKLGESDRLSAIRRLDAEARRLERTARTTDVDAFIESEWDRSPEWDGMTVMGPAAAVRARVRRPPSRRIADARGERGTDSEPADGERAADHAQLTLPLTG